MKNFFKNLFKSKKVVTLQSKKIIDVEDIYDFEKDESKILLVNSESKSTKFLKEASSMIKTESDFPEFFEETEEVKQLEKFIIKNDIHIIEN